MSCWFQRSWVASIFPGAGQMKRHMSRFEQGLQQLDPLTVATALGFATALAWLVAAIGADTPRALRFEHALSDFRTALLSDQRPTQHPRLAAVLVDERTLRDEPYSSPIDRGVLARLVAKLDTLDPKAIAVDISFYKPTEPAKDAALIAALRDAKSPVIMAAGDRRSEIDGDERAFQAAFLGRISRPAGFVNLDRDRDDVTRWKLPSATGSDFPKSFAALIAQVDGAADGEPTGRIAWLRRAADGTDAFFSVKAEDLIGPAALPALAPLLRDRLVLIGGRFADRDRHRVPLFASDSENQSTQIHGVFLHAHVVAQILDGRSVRELSHVPVVLVLGFLGFCLGWLFHANSFSWLVGGLATGGIILADLVLFWYLRRIVPYTPATIAWFVSAFAGYGCARLVRGLRRADP